MAFPRLEEHFTQDEIREILEIVERMFRLNDHPKANQRFLKTNLIRYIPNESLAWDLKPEYIQIRCEQDIEDYIDFLSL